MSYWEGKRVLVTGGGGFLGSHVVEHLGQKGCAEVFVVRQAGYDLTHEAEVMRLFREQQPEVVVHLAGLVGGIGANKKYPADYFYRNLMMGTLVLHYAWRSGAQKVAAAGAGCGYPEHASNPLKEETFWDGFPQHESAPYSLAKRMLHVQSMAYWRQHRFPIVVGVPGNIYGPYDNFDLEQAHVVPALVRKFVEASDNHHPRLTAWGTGKPTRDFVYAGDCAEGLLKAAETYDQSELVNLSSGIDTSVREVVEILREITGFQGEIEWDTSRPDGQSQRRFDVHKATRELGWQAKTSLREGLQKTVDWYRAHRREARNTAAAAYA